MTGPWRRDNCLPEVMIINAECINAKRCGQSCSRSLLFRVVHVVIKYAVLLKSMKLRDAWAVF